MRLRYALQKPRYDQPPPTEGESPNCLLSGLLKEGVWNYLSERKPQHSQGSNHFK
jgi:hypothetical protein